MVVYLVQINHIDNYDIKAFSSYQGATNWLYNNGFDLDINEVAEEDMGMNFYKNTDELQISAEIKETKIEDGFNDTKYQEKKEENQGQFATVCLVCGSNNVSIEEEYDYDYEENICPTGRSYLYCNECGNENRWY